VQVAKNTTCRFLCMMVTICKMDRRPQSSYSRTVLSTVCHQISVCISLISRASISLTALVSRLRSDRARHWCPMFKRTVPNFIWKRCVQTRRQNKWRAPVPGTQSERSLKAIFHCSRFARAGGANITLLSLWLPNLCIFCPPECSRTRHESRTTFNFLGVPGRLIFHVIKIGRSARAGKTTAMANGLKAVQLLPHNGGRNMIDWNFPLWSRRKLHKLHC
jgi:hypothetical protein